MDLKILSLNVRGLNRTIKRRQVFRWLHQQKSDVIFLQETYSSPQTIKTWKAEWGGKIIESHGSNHSRGVMILFKSRLDVTIEKIVNDKNGRYILCEALLDSEKFVFLNIYSPNDQTQQVQFLRGLSNSLLNTYANEQVVIGGDFNCAISEKDKCGGRSVVHKKGVIQEIKTLKSTQDLVDAWNHKHPNVQGFTWNNPSMKIQCRLDYFFISKDMQSSIIDVKVLPNIFSDHSALTISLSSNNTETTRGPGFWKFNNSLLTDENYIVMITKQIPEIVSKYQEVPDKGLFWEMIKMEIRASTIIFAKRKAKQKRDEENDLLMEFTRLQEKIRSNFSEATKIEMDRVKKKLAKVVANKTRGTMVRSKAQWYEFGEKNSKYFYNLEKRNHKRKHIISLKKEDGSLLHNPGQILEEEETFFKEIYRSRDVSPESEIFNHFFHSDGLNTLNIEEADNCEGLLTLQECANSLGQFKNNKTPGSDGFTIEFYRSFWNVIGQFMVDSFNYAFKNGSLSITQKLGVISLIPKKDKDKNYLKNWRPISLLNNDYKIATKAIALRLEKVLPTIISSSQTGYVKGRYIGESIRIISDMMSFTKAKNIPGLAVFLDFEKAFDSIEWKYLQKCLEVFNFGPQLRQWVSVLYKDITSCVLNNGFATKHFNLGRGVRQGCPLSGILFVIGVEILNNAITRSNEIRGIQIDKEQTVKVSQYADDTTVFVRDVQSIHNLFYLLSQFESCSGLKINQSKSEILWLGCWRHRKDRVLDLKLSDEPIYALGVYFSYNEELATEKNFFDKLNPLKKLLNIWSSRDLSIYGRINIVKTLAISKLTFICSVLDTPNGFTDEVNNIIFRYIWKNKNPKLKKTTITRSKNDGGLGMIDFSLFDKALKISWVKRLCSKETEPWKSIPLSLLSNVGGKLLFECNYDIKSLCINDHLPKFYRDIILHWQDLNRTTPEKKEDFLNQTIWNNRFIRIGKSSVYYRKWYQVGIQNLADIVNDEGTGFMSFNTFLEKFKIKCNFLQYLSLLSAIPIHWKKSLKRDEHHRVPTDPHAAIDKLTCKTVYNTLVNRQQCPPTADKRLIECGFDAQTRQGVYSLPFCVTKEVKLSVFQYKVIHNILYTNNILYKMKKKPNPYCPYCTNVEQTIAHLFFTCSAARSFWSEFTTWYNSLSKKKKTSLSKTEIIYGVTENCSSCSTLNHLIIIGKYFLYTNALTDQRFQFADYITLVRDKIETEKYIAIMTNNRTAFNKKWSNFLI